jgi:HK97 family phage major capsid protein
MDKRKIIGETFHRSFQLERKAINADARTVEVAFSSETESVERHFGVEILDHSRSAVRLARLNNGGAVLFNHRTDAHIGVIEKAWIDSDKVGRALLRFGQSARAKEVFQDIVDGILRHVSVGYVIHEMVREKTSDKEPDRYRVTDWEPLEVSMVPVPADASVGVGREFNIQHKENTMRKNDEQVLTREEQAEEDAILGTGGSWSEGRKERHRTAQILELSKHIRDKSKASEAAEEAIRSGMSIRAFQQMILDQYHPEPLNLASGLDLGRNDASRYSLMAAIRGQLSGKYDQCEHEVAVSRALESKLGKRAQGLLIPMEILLKRTIEKGNTGTGAGLIGVDHLSSLYIDSLRPLSQVIRLGARVLPGLLGDVSIPKKLSNSAGTWIAEDTAPSASVPDFSGTVTMAPKTVSAWARITRKMILQSAPAIEQLVVDDLNSSLGEALDYACLAGTGLSNQPLGILGQQGLAIVELGTSGGAPTWAKIVALESAVAVGNADRGSLAYATNAKVRGKLKTVEKASNTGQFIWGDMPLSPDGFGSMNGYPAAVSNQVPSNLEKTTAGTNLSAILFGDWSSLMIGKWSGAMDLVINPHSESTKGNIIVSGFVDADVAVRHVQSFAAIIDATTT